MTNTKESYNRLLFIGGLIHNFCTYAPLAFLALMLASFFYPKFDGIYSYIYIDLGPGFHIFIHKFSVSMVAISFILYYRLLRFTAPLLRMISSLLLVELSINFYDMVWSINSAFFREFGIYLPAAFYVIVTTEILYFIQKEHSILRLDRQTIAKLTFGILALQISLLELARSGFWAIMTQWDSGNHSVDPNASPIWIISKLIAFSLPLILIENRRKYEAKHILDPRVIHW